MSAVKPLSETSFRPMQEGDLSSVMAIEKRAYPYPWTETIMADCLRVGYCCWVMESGQRLIGYGIVSVAAEECHILNLCIDPDFGGHGLGKQLLDQLLLVATGHHARIAFLEVRPSNLSALSLYEKSGFNEVGLRTNYYPAGKGREDALILALDLLVDE